MSVEASAEIFAKYLLDNDLMESVKYSERKEGFKIKVDVSTMPEDIASASKKCCREMITTVNNVKIRVRFLSKKVLEESTFQSIMEELETYEDWLSLHLHCSKVNLEEYGEEFFKEFAAFECGKIPLLSAKMWPDLCIYYL